MLLAASEEDDKGTEAFADEKVAKLEKDLWMLKQYAKIGQAYKIYKRGFLSSFN